MDVALVHLPQASHICYLRTTIFCSLRLRRTKLGLKTILNNYEKFFRQSISYQKSRIFFSANVHREKKTELANILGVHNDLRKSHYLGLPSLIGRSERKVFGFAKDKV